MDKTGDMDCTGIGSCADVGGWRQPAAVCGAGVERATVGQSDVVQTEARGRDAVTRLGLCTVWCSS